MSRAQVRNTPLAEIEEYHVSNRSAEGAAAAAAGARLFTKLNKMDPERSSASASSMGYHHVHPRECLASELDPSRVSAFSSGCTPPFLVRLAISFPRPLFPIPYLSPVPRPMSLFLRPLSPLLRPLSPIPCPLPIRREVVCYRGAVGRGSTCFDGATRPRRVEGPPASSGGNSGLELGKNLGVGTCLRQTLGKVCISILDAFFCCLLSVKAGIVCAGC